MTDLHDHALRLAQAGLFVFPLTPGDKKPLVKWQDPDVATVDPERIDRHWQAHPDANIGVKTGELSDVAVIDIDDPDALEKLEADIGPLPKTLTASTGKGIHLYYRMPETEIRNSASKLIPGVDIRGEGGYVVAPPSLHPSGARYEWSDWRAPAPFPDAVLYELDRISRDNSTGNGTVPAPTEPVRLAPSAGTDRWGQSVLQGELDKLAAATPGSRNDVMFRTSCKVFEAVKGGHIEEVYARQNITAIALSIGLGQTEIEETLDSAWGRVPARDPQEPLRKTNDAVQHPNEPSLKDEQVRRRRRVGMRLMPLSEVEKLPPPEWLLEGMLPDGMTWLIGAPNVGKTFVALDMSLTVAAISGRPVIYFAGEGVAGLGKRVAAWRTAYPGQDVSTFYVVGECPNLLDPASIDGLREAIDELDAPPALVVVDTFARAFVGGDENSATDVGLAIDTLDRLRQEYGCSTMVLHHTNAGGERPRGSTAIQGAADAIFTMQEEENVGGGFGSYSVKCSKMKDAERPEPEYGQLRKSAEAVVAYPPVAQKLGYQKSPV